MHHTSSPRARTDHDRPWSAAERARFADACRDAEEQLSGTRHSADLLRYFKYLVARGFEDGSFVETQPKLATAMGVSTRTIREWDNHLDRLNLIWRTKEGVSYRRHITRFDPPPADAELTSVEPSADVAAITSPDELLTLAAHAIAEGDQERGQALAFQAAMAKAGLLTQPRPATFFAPDNAEDVIRSERKDRSDSSLKQTQAPGGGGKKQRTLTPEELSAIQALPHVHKLKAAGSTVAQCWLRLAGRPLAEIDLACRLALNAQWANDPGAVAIWYADQIAQGLIPLDAAPPPTKANPLSLDPPPSMAASRDSPGVWGHVQAALRAQLPPIEYETWIAETALLQLDDDLAIIGTPNIFVRDKLDGEYHQAIATALEQVIGRPVQLQVVLETRLAYVQEAMHGEKDTL